MQYLGGKARIARPLTEFLNSKIGGRDYYEPFVGGCNVVPLIKAPRRLASDFCKPLITMYQALQRGWVPPDISEEEYARINKERNPDDPATAFALFGCSFGGKFAGGYARSNMERNYAENARRSLRRKMATCQGVVFSSRSYEELQVENAVIYCDPPYENTVGYRATGQFDHERFWLWVRERSKNNLVFVSEYAAPDDFKVGAEFPTHTDLRNKDDHVIDRTEKLFYLPTTPTHFYMNTETIPPLNLTPDNVKMEDCVTPNGAEWPDVIGAGKGLGPDTAVEVLPDHAVRTHHKNSPSKLPCLAKCPGFVSAERDDKDVSETAAEMGTRLHEYMDKLLGDWVVQRDAGGTKTLLDMLNEFGQTLALDENERGLLVFCIRELDRWVGESGVKVIREIKVYVHRPDNTVLTAGHLDVLLLYPGGSGLLLDYKFGWLPVKNADSNEQGIAYALGVLEAYPQIHTLGVEFIQPRLGKVTQAVIKRTDHTRHLMRLAEVIERAEYVQRTGFTQETIPLLTTGDQCLYCVHSQEGTCPARLALLGKAASAMTPIPLPASFSLEVIDTPEKAALARYWVEVVEDFLDPIKKRAKEFALNSPDQKIGITLADGTAISYKIQQKKFDRSVGDALPVSECLKEYLTMQQILGCATLSLGKLEELATEAIFEEANGAEKRELDALKEKHRIMLATTPPTITKAQAAKAEKAARDRYSETRITKAEAKEQFSSHLTAHGLLSRPEGTSPSLVRDKSVESKKLTK